MNDIQHALKRAQLCVQDAEQSLRLCRQNAFKCLLWCLGLSTAMALCLHYRAWLGALFCLLMAMNEVKFLRRCRHQSDWFFQEWLKHRQNWLTRADQLKQQQRKEYQ